MVDKAAELNDKTTPVKKAPYEAPTWSGKPSQGLHLDVMKADKLVEKLIIDEKSCYLFGRNKDVCDFQLEHTSCSRVHAALVFHRHLKRCFLVDLGSTHGTFIGTVQLERQKPTQVQVDSVIRFGASTRSYTLREKPTGSSKGDRENGAENEENSKAGLLGLPESDTELDDLTEFNTAHNKRLASVGLDESGGSLGPLSKLKRKRKSSSGVTFKDTEEIINPEDVDPSIGKFRNMVQTSVVVPNKKMRGATALANSLTDNITKRLQSFPYSQGLYANLPGTGGGTEEPTSPTSPTASLPKLNITSAPEVVSPTVEAMEVHQEPLVARAAVLRPTQALEAPKKKYAKEAWPGKKPTPSLLI